MKQWGQGLAGTGGSSGEGNTIPFPIAFPTACENVIAIYDNGSTTIPVAATSDYTKNSFKLRCSAPGGSFNFRWEARGY
ncbi:gp53-like domain-containing protein [Leclercia sp. UBA7405]|uniref:gp53-like domain-containing protein n=1 Tax=Leclercia sp. UBA7405 TaxID=1946743 RepID=UPI003FA5BD65